MLRGEKWGVERRERAGGEVDNTYIWSGTLKAQLPYPLVYRMCILLSATAELRGVMT